MANMISVAAVWRGWVCRYWAQDWPHREEGKQRWLQNSHGRPNATSLQVLLWWRIYVWQPADTERTRTGTPLWQGLLMLCC